MATGSSGQKQIFGRVMHEWKHGDLQTPQSPIVKTPQQAIAIALREADTSNRESAPANRASPRKTKARNNSA